MKNLTLCVFTISVILSLSAINPVVALEDPINSELFSKEFSNTVEFNFFGKTEVVQKENAKSYLESFLSSIEATDIVQLHKGGNKSKSCNYQVFKIVSSDKSYRLFYYCEKSEGKIQIRKVRVQTL